VSACPAPYAPVWKLQPLVDVAMPDGGSLASMRNEPVLAEGRVYVATNATLPNPGHVYILAPGQKQNLAPLFHLLLTGQKQNLAPLFHLLLK
jgi:hypothetical protein